MTNNDPAVRRVRAKQMWALRKLRHEHKHLCQWPEGRYRDSSKTDIRKTLALYDFTPPSQLRELV